MKTLIVTLALLLTPKLVHAGCTWGTVLPVAFTYDPTSGTPSDATGSFVYKCSLGTPITIDIDYGVRSNRTMVPSSGPDVLAYTLYQDATRLVTWGNTGLTHLIVVSAPTSFFTQYVYGRLAAKQDVAVGTTYADTLTITINY